MVCGWLPWNVLDFWLETFGVVSHLVLFEARHVPWFAGGYHGTSWSRFEISNIILPIKVQLNAQSIMIWVISWMLFNNNFVFHIQRYIAMINASSPIMGWISHQLHQSFCVQKLCQGILFSFVKVEISSNYDFLFQVYNFLSFIYLFSKFNWLSFWMEYGYFGHS